LLAQLDDQEEEAAAAEVEKPLSNANTAETYLNGHVNELVQDQKQIYESTRVRV